MKKVLLSLLVFLSLLPTFGREESFSLQDRIQAQKLYLEVYPLLFKEPLISDNDKFSQKVDALGENDKKSYQNTLESLNPYLPPLFLKAILTYRFLKPNSEALEKVMLYSFFHKLFILRDAIDNPQTKNPIALLNVLRTITEVSNLETDSIYSRLIGVFSEKVKLISNFKDHNAFKDALTTTKLLTLDLQKVLKSDHLFLLNHTGFIPGNRVEVISENQTDLETMKWFSEVKIPFRPINNHPSFRNNPTFEKLKDVIASAKNTVFIDIFLLGGSIGANLGEFLIETTREKLNNNPNFKVLVLHDYSTQSEVDFEVRPIFEYLKSQREKYPKLKKSFYLLSADTSKHPPGVPFGFSNFETTNFPHFEKKTYKEPKIDHSKTLVVDGNYPYAQAFFGSKNWSDHSGGYFYDDVFFIQGPAATMTQASYYRDIEAAINLDSGEYFLKGEEILKDFKITLDQFPYIGKTVVRLTESDVDGTIKNTRNTLVDMIANAKESIYMEQLFLYDRYIVDALIKAKIKKPKLDIKVLLDNNDSYGMNGLPNTIFIRELNKYGIELRTRKTFKIKSSSPAAKWGFLYQENHRKITSVDGKILLGGSSNINPDSLQGSFREFGAQIYSPRLATSFNQRFLKAWKNPKLTQILDIKNFKAKIGGRTLSSETSNLINKMGALLLRSKKSLEEN